MTPEAIDSIHDLQSSMWALKYPQPLVAKVTGASINDLNNWRKRQYLFADSYEATGRVTYTGSGLIMAGLMQSLGWHFGPVTTNKFISENFSYIDKVAQDAAHTFLDDVIYSSPELVEDYAEYKLESVPASWTKKAEINELFWHNRCVVIFPVGDLIAKWAVNVAIERSA
ncbi:MAG: hypothetical protein JJU09_00450 [Rhodobacteraceae bacterium]|nr:hypothetical protein [Paracoccaceae bacterium]